MKVTSQPSCSLQQQDCANFSMQLEAATKSNNPSNVTMTAVSSGHEPPSNIDKGPQPRWPSPYHPKKC